MANLLRVLTIFATLMVAVVTIYLGGIGLGWHTLCRVAVCKIDPPASFWEWVGGMLNRDG